MSYCMSEWPSKWNIHVNSHDRKFMFSELYQQHITSRQLYLWSAPMDLVERYQLYLNQLPRSNESSMATQFYYNCTWPRFGPMCQYEFDDYDPYHSTLDKIVHDFYLYNKYKPTTLTCYTHLQCNRGSAQACLDWSEICDGKIDCLDGGFDEAHCWQLEINECEDNEYRCVNGQCIPYTYFRDDPVIPDCLDGSDEVSRKNDKRDNCDTAEPTFGCEDVTCVMNQHIYLSPLTSSCVKHRSDLLLQAMFSSKSDSVSDDCWSALKCTIHIPDLRMNKTCADLCQDDGCKEIITKNCPDMLFMPTGPILFGHVYFVYTKEKAQYSNFFAMNPQYVCYKEQLCDKFWANRPLLSFNNVSCRPPDDLFLHLSLADGSFSWLGYVVRTYNAFSTCHSVVNNMSTLCNRPSMYQCINSSKCISKYRFNDGILDCFYEDDEQLFSYNNTCSSGEFEKYFKCATTNRCISYHLVQDGKCDCLEHEGGFCDDESPDLSYAKNNVLFPTVCDGFIEMVPETVDGRNETDETECELWPCNNTYTRCDGHWNCLNGADEVGCDPSPLLQCPPHHHLCVSPDTIRLMCLPIEKANDGNIDCLGATEEPQLCRTNDHNPSPANFYCKDDNYRVCIKSGDMCRTWYKCSQEDQVCAIRNETSGGICLDDYMLIGSDVEKFLCGRLNDKHKRQIVHFTLDGQTNAVKHTASRDDFTILPHSSMIRTTRQREQRCHRGLGLRVWLDSEQNLTSSTCLCPPSFYGDKCQYQNQRVSLTMRFRALSDAWRTLFAMVVLLIDDGDERIIHSYDQFSYLPMRDCQIKFNVYLLYSTRPKNNTKHYSIHIDIYEKVSLAYRGSWVIPIVFPFLPVSRLAVQLDIPRSTDGIESCSIRQCIHGQCVKYSNDPKGTTFCRCNRGWSGRDCMIPHTCMCSLDSLCVGVSVDNRSLCVCPIDKLSSRCLLDNPVCQFDHNTTCLNGGQCIPIDEHIKSERKFSCICPKGFTGDRCEIADTKIIVSFEKQINLPQSMLVHFIQVLNNAPPERVTTFKTIPFNQDSVLIHRSHPFHIVFVELFNKNYYLTVLQKTYHPSKIFFKTLKPSDRCEHISEILNETIVKMHFLRRIKYYHLPCQQHSPLLSCFYDDIHLCLCDNYGQERHANCIEFDHQMNFDCFGESGCENGAQCFQDSATCAQTSMCVCPTCFYGTRCQFSTSGFGLSLDAILGYHILPHVNILHQPSAVQMSAALTTLMTVAGLVNGILSVITFKNKKLREVGCGFYLLGSSITTILTMTVFALKFWILVVAQMAFIVNRSLLFVQCISIDFLLRICLSMDQWLNACVAIERTIAALKGISFNKKKSRQVAKFIIFALLIVTISTAIHDPIYRRLIDDDNDDEKRVWCSVTYPSHVQVFNSAVNIIHFVAPFSINLISALIIIRTNARQRAIVHTHQTYNQLLREQVQQHNRLFIAPFVLAILAVPRLIISFGSGCMKSAGDSWLFLVGYLISFMPPMLTFILFVVPSKLYKDEFYAALGRFSKRMPTRLHFVS